METRSRRSSRQKKDSKGSISKLSPWSRTLALFLALNLTFPSFAFPSSEEWRDPFDKVIFWEEPPDIDPSSLEPVYGDEQPVEATLCNAILLKTPKFAKRAVHCFLYVFPFVPLEKAYRCSSKRSFQKWTNWMYSLSVPLGFLFAKAFETYIESDGQAPIELMIGEWVEDVADLQAPVDIGQQWGSTLFSSYFQNGVNLSSEIPRSVRFLANWIYTALTYMTIVGGTEFMRATQYGGTREHFEFAALKTAAMIPWTGFAQFLKTFPWTSHFYDRSAGEELMRRVRTIHDTQILREVETRTIEALSQEAEELKNLPPTDSRFDEMKRKAKIEDLERRVRVATYNLLWISKFRKGLRKGEEVPNSRLRPYQLWKGSQFVGYSLTMTALYFLFVSTIAGYTPGDANVIDLFQSLLTQMEPSLVMSKEFIANLPEQIAQISSQLGEWVSSKDLQGLMKTTDDQQ